MMRVRRPPLADGGAHQGRQRIRHRRRALHQSGEFVFGQAVERIHGVRL